MLAHNTVHLSAALRGSTAMGEGESCLQGLVEELALIPLQHQHFLVYSPPSFCPGGRKSQGGMPLWDHDLPCVVERE